MKVVVYAICKNERAFADRWMASMSEADEVYVLDTGSTDGTPQRLEELGAHVTVVTITPGGLMWPATAPWIWSLPMQTSACAPTWTRCSSPAGGKRWRRPGRQGWTGCSTATPGTSSPDGREGMVYWYDKMHRRWGRRWVNPVHEVPAV